MTNDPLKIARLESASEMRDGIVAAVHDAAKRHGDDPDLPNIVVAALLLATEDIGARFSHVPAAVAIGLHALLMLGEIK